MSATARTPGCSATTPLDGGSVDVGHDDVGAVLDEVAHQVAAHLADARHADRATGQRRLAPDRLRGRSHALEHAVRREHRAVAGATVGDGAAR